MKKILFVCTGNTCRSCMAEGILKHILREDGRLEEFSVSSAGVFADGVSRASSNAILVLRNEWGIDISDHISRKLTRNDVRQADVILTMTNAHRYAIASIYEEYANKVFTLGEYNDIVDPYGGSYDIYKKCAKEIRDSVISFMKRYSKKEGVHNMIAIGSDHAGLPLKDEIIKYFDEKNIAYIDYGTNSKESVDYSDYGKKVAVAVASKECDRGIVICGTGIGISIAANKVKGIRASLCTNSYMARMTRMHNDSNVLALGQRVIGVGVAIDIVDTWLNTEFEGGRHQRRIDKIKDIEDEQ